MIPMLQPSAFAATGVAVMPAWEGNRDTGRSEGIREEVYVAGHLSGNRKAHVVARNSSSCRAGATNPGSTPTA